MRRRKNLQVLTKKIWKKKKSETQVKEAEDSDSDDNIKRGKHMDFLSDFEMMLQRKKSMSGKRRRNRDGGTFISDADDVVSAMIVKMNEAAEEDRQLNNQKTSTEKINIITYCGHAP